MNNDSGGFPEVLAGPPASRRLMAVFEANNSRPAGAASKMKVGIRRITGAAPVNRRLSNIEPVVLSGL
jgi:hypothetical protein